MLNMRPSASIFPMSELPPYEINGSGIPVIGRSWIVIPIFWNTWKVIMLMTPAHTYAL